MKLKFLSLYTYIGLILISALFVQFSLNSYFNTLQEKSYGFVDKKGTNSDSYDEFKIPFEKQSFNEISDEIDKIDLIFIVFSIFSILLFIFPGRLLRNKKIFGLTLIAAFLFSLISQLFFFEFIFPIQKMMPQVHSQIVFWGIFVPILLTLYFLINLTSRYIFKKPFTIAGEFDFLFDFRNWVFTLLLFSLTFIISLGYDILIKILFV